MSHESKSENLSRRGFLKSAAVAGGAATVSALTPPVQAGVERQLRTEAKEASPSKGYRETAHVREYYEKARF